MDNALKLFSFYFAKPCTNISFKEYSESEYVILGHFTTTVFLDSILKNGIQSPKYTGNFSNKEIFSESDKSYIYLSGHFDRVFSQYTVKKFGGKEVLLLVKVKKDTLELDDINNIYSKKGLDLNCPNEVYNVLTKSLFSQCRTKQSICANQIVEVLIFDK